MGEWIYSSVVYHEGMLPGRISVNDWSKPFPSCKDDDIDEVDHCCLYFYYDGHYRIEAASSFFMHYIWISSILKESAKPILCCDVDVTWIGRLINVDFRVEAVSRFLMQFISIAFMSQSITKWRLPLIWRSRQIPKWQSLIHCILYFILFTSFIDFYGDYGVDDEGEEASTIISWILLHIKLYVGYYKQLLRDDDDVFHHLTKNMIDCNSNGEAPVFTLFSKWNTPINAPWEGKCESRLIVAFRNNRT